MKKFLTLTLVLFLSFPAFAESKDDYPYYAKITCEVLGGTTDIDACFYYFDPKRGPWITGITLTNLKNGTSIKKKWDTDYDSFRDIGYFICPKNKTCTWLRSEGKYETLYIDLPPDTRLDAESAGGTITVELYERSTGQLLSKASTIDYWLWQTPRWECGSSVVTLNTPTEIVEQLKKEFEYEGEYKDGLRDGQGTLTFADGRMYVGEFKDGFKHGQGTYTWPGGDHYVGEFKDDNIHGQGTYTWPDGTQYVGEFKDGLMHGQATMTYTDGTKDEGIWKEGEFLFENIAVTQEDEKFCQEIGFTINTPEYDNCVQKSAEKD